MHYYSHIRVVKFKIANIYYVAKRSEFEKTQTFGVTKIRQFTVLSFPWASSHGDEVLTSVSKHQYVFHRDAELLISLTVIIHDVKTRMVHDRLDR